MSVQDKILLTGGSGFIGTEVVDIALAQGFDVCNLDIAPPRKEDQSAVWRDVDVRDHERLDQEILEFQPDYLLHLASDIDITIDKLEEFKITIGGTKNVLAAAKKLPDLKRFIHISTQFVVKPGIEPTSEHHYDPYTLYGEAKAETEKLVWQADLKMPWFILRPVIIWGPYHPTFAQAILKYIGDGRYLHPVGREPIVRAFGYVTNTADQMIGFVNVDLKKAKQHIYYLGDDSIDYDIWADAFATPLTGKRAKRIPVSLLNFLGKAGDLVKIVGIPSPIDSGRAFRMRTGSKIDLSSTLALVGEPKVSFETGVEKTIDWLKEVR